MKSVIQVKTPFKNTVVTDLAQVRNGSNGIGGEVGNAILVSFSNGKLWEVEPFDLKNQRVISIDQFRVRFKGVNISIYRIKWENRNHTK